MKLINFIIGGISFIGIDRAISLSDTTLRLGYGIMALFGIMIFIIINNIEIKHPSNSK